MSCCIAFCYAAWVVCCLLLLLRAARVVLQDMLCVERRCCVYCGGVSFVRLVWHWSFIVCCGLLCKNVLRSCGLSGYACVCGCDDVRVVC